MEATDKSIILFSDIAEDEISEFQLFLFGQTVPVLETGEKCAWKHDYERFKEGKIKVKKFLCKCGKTRLLSVIDPNGKKASKEAIKNQMELLDAGCEVKIITLDEARKQEFCFECVL